MTDPKYMRPGLNFAVGKAVEELGDDPTSRLQTVHCNRAGMAGVSVLRAPRRTRRSGRKEAVSSHEAHESNVRSIHDLIAGCGPADHAERERLLWLLCGIHAGALTPVSENEKRGMERVLAILERKMGEGGGCADDNHNRFYRGRWSAFQECMLMLRAALEGPEGDRK